MLKALYECIISYFLWYNLYKDTIENEGFVLNPYNKCTTNKIINGKQFTVQWYVDDNKFTHVSKGVITGVIDIKKKHFRELVVSRGKKNTLLDMEI